MPSLHWPSKSLPTVNPAKLTTAAHVHPHGLGYPASDPKNRLILGDNLEVMAALLPEFAGQFNLIYADPPFFTNKHYPARVGYDEDSRKPGEWKLAEGYTDAWVNIDDYLDMLYPRLVLMRQLLAADGTFYLHLDWHASHYARLLLDEIFGPDRLLNEIVWAYHGPSPIRSAFNRKHDTILVYTQSENYTFNADAVREPYHPNTVKTFASSPKAGFGKIPNLRRGKVPEDWWYFPVVARLHSERTGYPTQKPAALLERILLASSNPGDLVGDFFCGSGTTLSVADRLGRNYVGADSKWRAIVTTQARMAAGGSRPFRLDTGAEFSQPDNQRPVHLTATLDKTNTLVTLSGSHVNDLAYWEIDPDFNGSVFYSAIQETRPRGTQAIIPTIKLPPGVMVNNPAVRFVLIDGYWGNLRLNKPI